MKFNTNNRLRLRELYLIGDSAPLALASQRARQHGKRYAATWTGEKRPPKAGEWYISGAIPEAYRAPNDLNQPHAIAILVLVEPVTDYRGVVCDNNGNPPDPEATAEATAANDSR